MSSLLFLGYDIAKIDRYYEVSYFHKLINDALNTKELVTMDMEKRYSRRGRHKKDILDIFNEGKKFKKFQK